MAQMRHVIMGLMFLSALTLDLTRTDINIAIVTMTEPFVPHVGEVVSDVCPHTREYDEEREFLETGNYSLGPEHHELPDSWHRRRYDWDQEVQGMILGSFSWAYMMMHVPGGLLTQRFGGKTVVVVGLIVSGILSALTPFITDFHVSAFMLTRVLTGVAQGGFYPAAFGILCNWISLSQRSLAFALLGAGCHIGSFLYFYASGFIVLASGWTMLFFVPALVSGIVGLGVICCVSSSPQSSHWISGDELEAIESRMREESATSEDGKEGQEEEQRPAVPWLSILSNKAVLSAAALKFSLGWNFFVFCVEMPKYLNDVMHEDLRTNGKINAVNNLMNGVFILLTGILSEKLIKHGLVSRTVCRKVFSLFSGLGYGVCLFLIPSVGCNHALLKIVLFFGACMHGFAGGSDLPIASEMSTHFPSTLFAVCNMAGMGAGFIVPVFAGVLLTEVDDTGLAWTILFYTSAALSAIASALFLAFASAERQDFDYIGEEEKKQRGIEIGKKC